jgi:hypothetical protein
MRELTLSEFVQLAVERHDVNVHARATSVLRAGLGYPTTAYGDVKRPISRR